MALPIAATPKLGVADTKRFLKRVEKDLKKPAKPVVSKAEVIKAVKFAREYFESRQKQNC